jgi:Domain of unknown function (DUF1902)
MILGTGYGFAESSNLPGLSGEAPTSGELIHRIPRMIATIAEANGFEAPIIVHILPA